MAQLTFRRGANIRRAFLIDDVEVTATAAELNAAADITTAGAAEASKAVLLDANKSVTGLGRMALGAQANVAASAPALSATYPGTLRVFSDDGGANIADSVRGVQSRVLLTIDQSGGTIRALQGQLKALTGIDVTTGIYTAVQGYLELAATHSAKTGSTLSCFDASAEIGTALTVDSGGEFFGVHIETTGAGTLTNNGTAAAVGVTIASGAAKWPVGLYNQVGAVAADVKVQAEDAASLPCMIFSGAAANDANIVTAVGADTLWADGSLYISVVDGAGKLFQKQADTWVDLQT